MTGDYQTSPPIMLQHHLSNSHFAGLNLTIPTQFSLCQHRSTCKNRHVFDPCLLSCVCFDSSFKVMFLFLDYSAVLVKGPIFSGKGNRAGTGGSQPLCLTYERAVFFLILLFFAACVILFYTKWCVVSLHCQ